MDPVIIGLLCGAVGLFTGVASMLAFRASERSRTVDLTVGEPTLAPGAAEVVPGGPVRGTMQEGP